MRQLKAQQEREAAAASRIQSVARMRQGQAIGHEKRAEKRAQLELKAAIQIQSLGRMMSGRREVAPVALAAPSVLTCEVGQHTARCIAS